MGGGGEWGHGGQGKIYRDKTKLLRPPLPPPEINIERSFNANHL